MTQHKTRLARSGSHQTAEARWDKTQILRNVKVDDHDSLVALKVRYRIHLNLRHRGVDAASAIEDPHANGSRSEVGRYSADVEGKGTVRVEAFTLSVSPAVVMVGASMTVGAGFWDKKGDAPLLLGLLFVHGLEDFLAVVGYSLQAVSKPVRQFG
jgi:hypothetical protein